LLSDPTAAGPITLLGGLAGHASATASLKLTFHLDHSGGPISYGYLAYTTTEIGLITTSTPHAVIGYDVPAG
jgi:hypothetical protein